MITRAVVIGLLSVALAVLSFFAAAGNMRGGAAALASFSPLPTDGVYLALQSSLAVATVETLAQQGEPVANMEATIDRGLAAAQQSYRREPLFVETLRNIAMLRAKTGDAADQVPLILLASRFSRRDPGTDLLLARYYGGRGDMDAMLEWLDYSLRTSTTASELMIPVLLQAAQDPRTIEPLTNLLARDPLWKDEFWKAIDSANEAHVNIAKVRKALHRQGRRLNPQHDESLMMLLAQEGRFAEAYELASLLPRDVHAGRSSAQELVTNDGFTAKRSLPPFGWQLSSSGQIDAYIDPATDVLHLESFGNSGGSVAHQLIKIPASRVRVTVAFKEWQPENAGVMFASLKCAKPGDLRPPALIELSAARISQVVAVPARGCPFYWLSLEVRPRDDGRPLVAELDSVSLRAEK